MLVVPLSKDVIETKDGIKYKVIEYTHYKDGGPAVYVRGAESKSTVLVYFFDIAAINGTKVEYSKGSKVFNALGKIARDQHLPQPDDKINVLNHGISDEDTKHTTEVASLKLKSKSLGVNKGMFVKDTKGDYFRIKNILYIERALGGSGFNREVFQAVYKDYIGV